MKMQYVLREIPEKFNAKGGYNGHFVNQKQLDAKAVVEEAIAMDYVPAYSPAQVKGCALGLLESMLAGVARDGNPRCVDGFFKVSPVLKGRFAKADSSYDPKVNSVAVNVQLLHELKPIDTANWSFINATPSEGGDTPPEPTGITLTGVHAPGIEPPMIHLESGVWFDGTGLDGWTGGEGDEVLAKNNRAEEAEWTRVDLHEDVGGEVVFDGGMLKMDEGVWTILDNLGIVEGSEVRFKVTVGGNSAETVATVAEA